MRMGDHAIAMFFLRIKTARGPGTSVPTTGHDGPAWGLALAGARYWNGAGRPMIDADDDELYYKNPPTPCLWQALASTQKTKRKTRPAIRRRGQAYAQPK